MTHVRVIMLAATTVHESRDGHLPPLDVVIGNDSPKGRLDYLLDRFKMAGSIASSLSDPTDTLVVFLAPEFYFQRSHRSGDNGSTVNSPYNTKERDEVYNKLKGFGGDMLFVPGSVVWELPSLTGPPKSKLPCKKSEKVPRPVCNEAFVFYPNFHMNYMKKIGHAGEFTQKEEGDFVFHKGILPGRNRLIIHRKARNVAIELCADHDVSTQKKELGKFNIDLHIVISAGQAAVPSKSATSHGGLLIGCDGDSYPGLKSSCRLFKIARAKTDIIKEWKFTPLRAEGSFHCKEAPKAPESSGDVVLPGHHPSLDELKRAKERIERKYAQMIEAQRPYYWAENMMVFPLVRLGFDNESVREALTEVENTRWIEAERGNLLERLAELDHLTDDAELWERIRVLKTDVETRAHGR